MFSHFLQNKRFCSFCAKVIVADLIQLRHFVLYTVISFWKLRQDKISSKQASLLKDVQLSYVNSMFRKKSQGPILKIK